MANYETKDGRFLSLCCLQAGKYWLGRAGRATRPRGRRAVRRRRGDPRERRRGAAICARCSPSDGRRVARRLAAFSGQWTVVQDTLEAADDPQTVANGYVLDCDEASGTPFRLAAAPVQYDRSRPSRAGAGVQRARRRDPQRLGLDMDTIMDLKMRGVVA